MSPTEGAVDVQILADVGCALGEGPVWDAPNGRVLWVDIDRGHLWTAAFEGGVAGAPVRAVEVAGTLGAAAPAADGGLLLARAKHLEHRTSDGAVRGAVEVIPARTPSRLNDGCCDPAGRFVVGSLALDGEPGQECFWRLEPDGSLTVLDDDVSLANGIAWSPDGGTMYTVDTFRNCVYARDYDAATGRTGARHVVVSTPDELPDGLAVDVEGHLWVAFWGAGELRRFDPTGRQVDTLRTGAPLTTSCAFAGDAMQTLVVTTAGKRVSGHEHSEHAGAVLSAAVDVPGVSVAQWEPVALDG